MKLFLAAATALGLVAGSVLAQDPPATKKAAAPAPVVDSKTLARDASYSVGYNMGKTYKTQGVEFDLDALAKGLNDGFTGANSKLTEDQMKSAIQAFVQVMQSKAEEKSKMTSVNAKAAGDKFLADNKTKPGVVTLPSGLQYKVLKQGNGPKPKPTDTVTTHYEGKLVDGTVFDSSIKRGEPASFPVNGVIAGWTEALQLMPVGSKWQLVIPSALAYGENPRPGAPQGVLVFEVELLKIGDQ